MNHLVIGGSYYIYDESGAFYTNGAHCGATTVDVPNGGHAIIRLDAVGGPAYCLSQGVTPGEATKGTIRLVVR